MKKNNNTPDEIEAKPARPLRGQARLDAIERRQKDYKIWTPDQERALIQAHQLERIERLENLVDLIERLLE